MKSMPKALWGPGVLALSLAFFLSGSAQAADFAVTGLLFESRGTVDLPLAPALGQAGPGVPVAGTVMQTGAAVPGGGPATITLPPGVISDPANLEGFIIPVPDVIQLTTSIAHYGPTTTSTVMLSGGPGSFGYCPGMTVATCTTVGTGAGQGTKNGIVTYTAGPNKFGGTIKTLLSGTGLLTRKGGALPPTVMTTMGGTVAALPFSANNGAIGGSGLAQIGLSYAAMVMLTFPALPDTHPYGYMTTPKGLLITGPVVGPGIAETQMGTGFPFTTGTVTAYRTLNAQGAPNVLKFTMTGYDNRTAAGAGRIQLVAGGMSRGQPTDGSAPAVGSAVNRGILTMNLTPQPALPLSSPAALVTLASLVSLSAGFAISRRKR